MIRMSTAMTISAHQGENGNHTKFKIAEITAAIMPATRAQVAPLSRKMPITSSAKPTRR